MADLYTYVVTPVTNDDVEAAMVTSKAQAQVNLGGTDIALVDWRWVRLFICTRWIRVVL